jgi:hypothetical protein
MVDLREPQGSITYTEFDSKDPNIFLYTNAVGYIEYCDLRVSSNVQGSAIRF